MVSADLSGAKLSACWKNSFKLFARQRASIDWVSGEGLEPEGGLGSWLIARDTVKDLLPQVDGLARAEHSSADAIAVDAIKQHVARRFRERNKLEAAEWRGTLNDDEVEEHLHRLTDETRPVSKPS